MGIFSFLTSARADLPALPPLMLRNTLSGELEEFQPLSKEVRMYNCGPTVYDRQHIGNLRPYVLADTLRRTLELWGYPVKQVINITDVGHLTSDADTGEDKMEKSAKSSGKSARDIAREITDLWFEDLDALGINRGTIEFPRATDYIAEQVALVKALLQKGYAYQITDGIYFDTSKFPGYGKLGGIRLAAQQAGTRVEENREKKSPHDFALWKFSVPEDKRQQEWETPWGTGFPGWHIECTAMIFKLLGRQIDIHTGGIDHIAVHHNNEIAQAEAISGKQYARYWLHNEFITVEGKKISKSLGNTVYLSQLRDRGFSPRSLRYLYLMAHYRSPMNFTWQAVEAADTSLRRLKQLFWELPKSGLSADKQFLADLYAALAHDLDTPVALARVWDLARNASVAPAVKRASLAEADRVLGLGLGDPQPTIALAVVPLGDLPQDIQLLVAEREHARRDKDFPKADRIRKQIEGAGYVLKDTPEGPKVIAP